MVERLGPTEQQSKMVQQTAQGLTKNQASIKRE
jgi:hypothetical protein